jgi:hypothetical protein
MGMESRIEGSSLVTELLYLRPCRLIVNPISWLIRNRRQDAANLWQCLDNNTKVNKPTLTRYENNMQSNITPPGSLLINPPLTPPDTGAKLPERAAKILRLLKERKSGRISSIPTWQTFKLHFGEYIELLDVLQTYEDLWGYVEDKVRYVRKQCGKWKKWTR